MKVVKNKIAPPMRVAEFDLLFGSGIDHVGCVIDAGKKANVIVSGGAWLSYGEQKWQGREKCVEDLKTKPELLKEIEAKIRELGSEATDQFLPGEGEDFEGSEAEIDAEIAAEEEMRAAN